MHSEAGFRRLSKFAMLTAVAVGGTLIFGAAAKSVLPTGRLPFGPVSLTFSTGCSWLTLGALLIAVTRKPMMELAEVCLVTMACGEAILLTGAFLDWLLRYSAISPVMLNIGIVAVADIAMATSFAGQLRAQGVSVKVSIPLWLLGLNGSWAVFLALYLHTPFGGR